MLDKFERLVSRACDVWAAGAAFFLLAMLLLNTADVILTQFFDLPIEGTFELTGLFLALVAPLGGAITHLVRLHIRVEIFTMRLPLSAKVAIDRIVSLLALGLLVILTWRIGELSMEFQRTTSIISYEFPLPYYPFVLVVSVALIPFCLVAVLDFLNPLRKPALRR